MNKLAMHYATRAGNLCRVRQLIEAGVPMDSLDEQGWTPLHLAALYGEYEVAALLIDSKCNINLKDRHGRTPVILAAAYYGQKDTVDLLLRRGAQVNCVDCVGRTLLHYASSRTDWTDIVRLILDIGEADLNAVDQGGSTPLMLAVVHEQKETAALLIRSGADTNVKDNQGRTALNEGIRRRNLTNEEIRLFVQNGAFLENCDYEFVSQHPFLKENLLKDVEFCTQSVVNRFNRQSLPALNSIAYFARRLPNVDNFKLGPRHIDEVRNLVKCEIERNTFCNVVKVRPVALSALCVLSLITCQSGKKRAASTSFGHSPLKKKCT